MRTEARVAMRTELQATEVLVLFGFGFQFFLVGRVMDRGGPEIVQSNP